MAMLAEPKRKQKFSFDPRNTNWSNDETKFGHKLMEKMGWSKGKGLGANEDGKTDHITVSVKNDTRGVGCSKSHVDNWIAHQDDFNALLSNLQQDHSTGDNVPEAGEPKVISLEQKSRTSKGRLHYQKFTKGKDLSLKSETDLDCVFGKRKSQSGTSTPQPQSEPSSDSESHSQGFNTVTSTDSVQDYFKKKMAEKLNKLSGNIDTVNEKVDDNCSNSIDKVAKTENSNVNENDCTEIKTKKKKSKKRKADHVETEACEILDGKREDVENDKVVETVEVKKKKKSKKKKQDEIESEGCFVDSVNDTDSRSENPENVTVSKKKLKKKKKNSEKFESPEKDYEETKAGEIDANLMKEELIKNQEDHVSEDVPKKKKSKKRKGEENNSDDVKPKKKVTFDIRSDDDDDDGDECRLKNNPKDIKPAKDFLKEEGNDQDGTDSQEIQTSKGAERPEISMSEVDMTNLPRNIHENDTTKGPLTGTIVKSDLRLRSSVNETSYRNSGLEYVKEVEMINKSFRGSNVKHLHGYRGMNITSQDVETKLKRTMEKDQNTSRKSKVMHLTTRF